jgi:predicted nucleic acid-binding protein
MTGNKLLLDTNIVIELFKGDMQILAVLDERKLFTYQPQL